MSDEREIVVDDGDPRGPKIAIAILVTERDREFIDAARARSIELAVQRGHIVRTRA